MNATIHAPIEPAAAAPHPPDAVIGLTVGADDIAVVCFDRPGSSANVFDTKTLHALGEILDALAGRTSLRGAVFLSAKPAVFIAGADLKELASAEDREALVDLGQQTFAKIAALPCVTVAAIHGACAGGGLELALACDCRVASLDRATRIGLPEVRLGLIPAWGGSTRLPRILGLSRALQTILRGELMPAPKAAKLGLVDGLAPRERLLDLAKRRISRGRPSGRNFRNRWWMAAAPVVAALARRSVLKKSRGHYPAPLAAIDVVAKSLSRTIPQSLAAERKAILDLADTEACRNLLRVFFLQDRAKHTPTPQARTVRRTAVIGAGVMGAGIAQWFASRGMSVLLRDVGAKELARGLQRAEKLFAGAKRRGLLSATEVRAGMDRIVPAEIPVDMKAVDLVVEAAVERMDLKQRIFADLEERTRPEAILATNTSALSVSELSRGLRHPLRVVGLHFFNPVHRMQLVEVVRGNESSDEAVDTAVAFVRRIGKLPVVVQDRPGFLVNRILLPYLLEAAGLFEAGVDARALDECMLDFGMPMGPMRLLDEIGLDVGADVAETLCAAFPERMRMPVVLASMLEAGIKGRKSGAGFYAYRDGRPTVINRDALKFRFRRAHGKAELERGALRRRMVLLMINESARCLEERIVEQPQDVDFAMIMGTGFAPFRGGPLRHADALGIGNVTDDLWRLSEGGEPYFVPCERLLEMAGENRRFYDD